MRNAALHKVIVVYRHAVLACLELFLLPRQCQQRCQRLSMVKCSLCSTFEYTCVMYSHAKSACSLFFSCCKAASFLLCSFAATCTVAVAYGKYSVRYVSDCR